MDFQQAEGVSLTHKASLMFKITWANDSCETEWDRAGLGVLRCGDMFSNCSPSTSAGTSLCRSISAVFSDSECWPSVCTKIIRKRWNGAF